MLINLHIPKAGGKTLGFVLHRVYGDRLLRISKTREDWTEPYDKYLDRLETLEPEALSSFRMITGHVLFRDDVPRFEGAQYFTLLRNPVDRIVSFYNYCQMYAELEVTGFINERCRDLSEFVRMPFTDVLQSRLSEAAKLDLCLILNNGQTKMIAGNLEQCRVETNALPLLELALRNIDRRFAFVGAVEEFDRSLVLLALRLGWSRVPGYVRENVSRRGSTLDRASIDVIEQRNALDCLLHRLFLAETRAAYSRLPVGAARLLSLKARSSGVRGVVAFRRTLSSSARLART